MLCFRFAMLVEIVDLKFTIYEAPAQILTLDTTLTLKII